MGRDETLDLIKGIAVILMVIYHFFSLIDAKINTRYTNHPYFQFTGQFSRMLFIFLLGYNFKGNKIKINKILYLLFLSLLINFTTILIYPNNFVRFGILHFMTISIILLSYLTKIHNVIPLISGIIVFIIYILVLNKRSSKNVVLTSIGYKPNYSTMDYFPIFKWFWLVGLGHYISKNTKKHKNKTFKNKILKCISYLGKNSLIIYVIHFPIIFGLHKILKFY